MSIHLNTLHTDNFEFLVCNNKINKNRAMFTQVLTLLTKLVSLNDAKHLFSNSNLTLTQKILPAESVKGGIFYKKIFNNFVGFFNARAFLKVGKVV